MRSTSLLAQFGLWVASVEAFYPWEPEWLVEKEERRSLVGSGTAPRDVTMDIRRRIGKSSRPVSERAASEASYLWHKYNGRQSTHGAHGALERRSENQYDVMKASEPSSSLTSGIHQDGSDYSYFIEAQFGSEGKGMYMLIDTGAGSSWVMGSDCDTEACALHNSYGPKDSDTLEETSREFSINYGSGKVKGVIASDTIGLAGMSFKYEFGIANTVSSDFIHFPFDGIIGLGMNKGANKNFLETVKEAGEVDANIFSVYLNRAADGDNHGEIRFGSTNKDRYSGDITYTSLGKDNGDWAIPIDDMSYDGKDAGVGKLAYIDTGTSFMFSSKESVKKVHSVIPGAESGDGITFTVPCDSDKSLTFAFSGVSFEVSPKDWISPENRNGKCTSNIYGHEVVSGAWLLGDAFIKNVYTVFDKDKKRIGFASLSDSAPESSESTASSGTSKTSDSQGSTPSQTSNAPSTTDAAEVTGSPTYSGSISAPSFGLSGMETVDSSVATASAETEGSSSDDSDSGAHSLFSINSKYATGVACALASLLYFF